MRQQLPRLNMGQRLSSCTRSVYRNKKIRTNITPTFFKLWKRFSLKRYLKRKPLEFPGKQLFSTRESISPNKRATTCVSIETWTGCTTSNGQFYCQSRAKL